MELVTDESQVQCVGVDVLRRNYRSKSGNMRGEAQSHNLGYIIITTGFSACLLCSDTEAHGPEIFETASRGFGRMRSFAKRGFFLRFGCFFGERQLQLVSLHLKSLTTSPTPQLHDAVEDLATNSAGTTPFIHAQLGDFEGEATPVLMRPYRRSCGARSLPHDGRPPWPLDV
jgi:hypothetical protein